MKKGSMRAGVSYFSKDGSGIFMKQNYHKTYTTEHVRFYFNWQHKLDKLSPTSISLLFYLTEQMDGYTNEVFSNQTIVNRYKAFRKSISVADCSDSAVRSGFQQLKKENLLISTPTIGLHIVNPVYLFKEAQQYRHICINRLLEHTKEDNWVRTNLFEALSIH